MLTLPKFLCTSIYLCISSDLSSPFLGSIPITLLLGRSRKTNGEKLVGNKVDRSIRHLKTTLSLSHQRNNSRKKSHCYLVKGLEYRRTRPVRPFSSSPPFPPFRRVETVVSRESAWVRVAYSNDLLLLVPSGRLES